MNRAISIGLLSLLLFHILAYGLVVWHINWQEERDLSNRLTVYRTVDSIVEFYVPLRERAVNTVLPEKTTEGFSYKGSYYEIVRQEVKNETLHLLGLVNKSRSFWQQDLLGFIHHQFGDESNQSQKKAGHLLKNLLKEYYTSRRVAMCFSHPHWRESVQIPSLPAFLSERAIPLQSLPPEV